MKKYFITGIGTDVGKTVASAIVVQALDADYWKPIQAGDLDKSDSLFIESKVKSQKSKVYEPTTDNHQPSTNNRQPSTNNQQPTTKVHENAYRLNTACSPHLAAKIDGIAIDLDKIIEPKTDNNLVIEGAGGVFVPINDSDCVIDLIKSDYKIIVVSRHYLGSINHTLLTIEALKNRGFTKIGIIFNGNENPATEEIILKKTDCVFLGRIDDEPYLDSNVIGYYADLFREQLLQF